MLGWSATGSGEAGQRSPPLNKDLVNKNRSRLNSFKNEATSLINQFLNRGGVIRVHKNGTPTPLQRSSKFITGCSSGKNRSQAFRGYLITKGIPVNDVIAGETSLFNPDWSKDNIPGLPFNKLYGQGDGEEDISADEIAFLVTFPNATKIPQLGNIPQYDYSQGNPTPESFYVDHFKQIEPSHFIVFALSCKNTIIRLLETGRDLTGFEVTIVDWDDTIREGAPRESTNKPATYETVYKAFKERCEQDFPVVD